MNTTEAIFTRRSIRSYLDRPVPQETLDRIFSAAMMSPSWKNTQTPGYVVIRSSEAREAILDALPSFNQNTAQTAPVIIVMTSVSGRCGYERDGSFSTNKEDRWEFFDAGLACQTLCLAAWEEGLGTCIMGLYDENRVSEIIGLPQNRTVTAVVVMGYPAQSPTAPKRKTIEEKITYV